MIKAAFNVDDKRLLGNIQVLSVNDKRQHLRNK